VLSHRLDDRIRELCAEATVAGPATFAEVIAELRSAIRQHASRVREMALRHVVGRPEAASALQEHQTLHSVGASSNNRSWAQPQRRAMGA
jgi:hypothetical protein